MNPAKYLRLMGNYERKAPPSGVQCDFFPSSSSFYIPAAKRLTHPIQLKGRICQDFSHIENRFLAFPL